MAEVQQPTIASDKKKSQEQPKKKIFGELKKPDVVIYRMIKTNDMKMRDDTPLYPPYKRFPNYDIITWEDGTRAIRWLPGEQSIFVDEQEKDGRKIPENILNNPNNRFEIINGDILVQPHQKTKIQFLDICNRNADSPHRTGSVQAVFRKYSEDKKVEVLSEKQNKQQEAIDKAFSATPEQITFHADYLNIALIDRQTQASRSDAAIITDYRQIAIDDPVKFLKTFDDEDLKSKYKIKQMVLGGVVSMNIIPGKAVIAATKEELCDIPDKADQKQIVDTLFLFSQTSKGVGFLKKVAEWGD